MEIIITNEGDEQEKLPISPISPNSPTKPQIQVNGQSKPPISPPKSIWEEKG